MALYKKLFDLLETTEISMFSYSKSFLGLPPQCLKQRRIIVSKKDNILATNHFPKCNMSKLVISCRGSQLQRQSLRRGFFGVPIPTFVRGHECFCDVLKPMLISSPHLILIELLNLAIQYQQI